MLPHLAPEICGLDSKRPTPSPQGSRSQRCVERDVRCRARGEPVSGVLALAVARERACPPARAGALGAIGTGAAGDKTVDVDVGVEALDARSTLRLGPGLGT